jgi:hypothetical protein
VACGVTNAVTDLDVLLYKPCTIAVTIEKDKSGEYEDKNKVSRVSPVVSWNAPIGDKGQLPREASTTPKAFEATKDDMDDEITF